MKQTLCVLFILLFLCSCRKNKLPSYCHVCTTTIRDVHESPNTDVTFVVFDSTICNADVQVLYINKHTKDKEPYNFPNSSGYITETTNCK